MPTKEKKRYDVTDSNWIDLAIFSATKQKKKAKNQEIITFDKGQSRLYVTYGGSRVPSQFDRRVLCAIEKLFFHKFSNLTQLKDLCEKRIEEETLAYIKGFNENPSYDGREITTDNLTEAQQQTILYQALSRLQNELKLYLTSSQINAIVLPGSRGPSMIKESLEVLKNTSIQRQSTYRIGKEFNELDYPSFPMINYFATRVGNKDQLVVSLSPFHLYNLIMGRFTEINIDLLNSFKSSIACRLAEYLPKKIFGQQKYGHNDIVIWYEDLVAYLHLQPFTAKSRILQQLEKPLNELKEKKVIIDWKMEKNLMGYEFHFYHDPEYFVVYYKTLDPETKEEIEKKIAEAMADEQAWGEFLVTVEKYLKEFNLKPSSEKYQKIRLAYIRYRILKDEILS